MQGNPDMAADEVMRSIRRWIPEAEPGREAAGGETWNIVFDGGGADIAAGTYYDLKYDAPYAIQQWTLLAAQSGSIVIDVWKSAALPSGFPPSVATSITAAAKPTLSTAAFAEDTTLAGWNKALEARRVLRFNVDSCTGIQVCTLALKVRRAD